MKEKLPEVCSFEFKKLFENEENDVKISRLLVQSEIRDEKYLSNAAGLERMILKYC
ncbi:MULTISPECIES: hypothetical protein [Clostridium]|uniref:Uncharacterized protein n=1 Tax=Clostridium lapidicellarium TaxID=3240931 RepID=A0ABV4DT20_9CLOT